MKHLDSLLRATAVAASLLGAVAGASAGTLDWSFSYEDVATNGSMIIASGTLMTDDTAVGGQFLVTGVSGTRNGASLTLDPGYAGADDELSAGTRQTSFAGISFTDGTNDFNVFWNGAGYSECSTLPDAACTGLDSDGTVISFTASAAAVPEPAPVAMLALGLAALAIRRKRGA